MGHLPPEAAEAAQFQPYMIPYLIGVALAGLMLFGSFVFSTFNTPGDDERYSFLVKLFATVGFLYFCGGPYSFLVLLFLFNMTIGLGSVAGAVLMVTLNVSCWFLAYDQLFGLRTMLAR